MSESEELQRRLALLHGQRNTCAAKVERYINALHDRQSKIVVDVAAHSVEAQQLATAVNELRDVSDQIRTLTRVHHYYVSEKEAVGGD